MAGTPETAQPETEPKTKLKDEAPEALVPEDLPEDERIDAENDVA